MQPPSRRSRNLRDETDGLERRYGKPVKRRVTIEASDPSTGPAGFPLSSRRTAEVVLVVPRAGERVLVHTKRFYPGGIWRLPTGGVHRRESIESAVLREGFEETGRELRPVRFLFHLQFRWDGVEKEFQSYGFLMSRPRGRIRSIDRREQITAFRDSDRQEIAGIADRLTGLGGRWTGWGRFRAAPHHLLLELWPEGAALATLARIDDLPSSPA